MHFYTYIAYIIRYNYIHLLYHVLVRLIAHLSNNILYNHLDKKILGNFNLRVLQVFTLNTCYHIALFMELNYRAMVKMKSYRLSRAPKNGVELIRPCDNSMICGDSQVACFMLAIISVVCTLYDDTI